MKEEKKGVKKLITKVRKNYIFRTFLFACISFFTTLVFAGYNTYLGVIYKADWNISIAIYYFLLLCVRVYVVLSERRIHNGSLTDGQAELKRRNLHLVQSVLLLLIDVALITPIALMVRQKKIVDYTQIPAIAMAAYTIYKVILSTHNIIKTKKEGHLSIKMLRTVNFVDALVSLLTLQYTLIMTFGGAGDKNIFIVCAISSFALWSLLVIVSVTTFVQSIKLRK